MKRLLLLSLCTTFVLAAQITPPPTGGGGGLPTGCTSPGVGQINCSGQGTFGTVAVGNKLPAGTGTVVSPVTGIEDVTPELLPRWRLALAKARNGTADAKILCIGDSTTYGSKSTGDGTIPAYYAYPWRLATLLGSIALPGLATPITSLTGGIHDDRWTYGLGWTSACNFGFASNACATGTSGGGDLVFTPGGGVTYDSADVYYQTFPGSGTLTITMTGGTPAVVNLNTTAGVGKTTVHAGSAGASNAVAMACTVATNCKVYAVEPFLSTSSHVRVANAGVPSSNTTNWASNAALTSTDTIKAYAPDLTIISLGINDASASVPTATFQANLATIIAAAQLSGDVVLMTFPPSSGTTVPTNEALYVPAYATLSASGLPLVSLWNRFRGTYQSQWMADATHPNDYGYWDMAGAVISLITAGQ